jgi:hypothetical protein
VCDAYDAICVSGTDATEAYYLRKCLVHSLQETQEDKCHGRVDVSCQRVASDLSVCRPSCGSDSQCPAGRYCNVALGVCVDDPPLGDPIGAPCDPDGPNTCAGYCFSPVDGWAFCSGVCTLGAGIPGCGLDPEDPTPPGSAYCETAILDPPGDTGICVPRCNCDGDCPQANEECWSGNADFNQGICWLASPNVEGMACQ